MKNKHIVEDIAAVLIIILAVSLILLFLLPNVLLGKILMVIATVSFLTVCGITCNN